MKSTRWLISLVLLLACSCSAGGLSFPSPVPPVAVIDDFETAETNWLAGTNAFFGDSSAIEVAIVSDRASHGKQALQLTFEATEKPKAIFFLDQPLDLTQASFLQFEIYHEGTIIGVGIGMNTGPEAVWYEAASLSPRAGEWVTLSFDLTAGNYKAASTGWEFRTPIADLNQVSRLAIVLYPARSGSVFIDYVRLDNTSPVP